MSIVEQPKGERGEPEAPLAELQLPRRISEGVSRCGASLKDAKRDITYLWVHVTDQSKGGCGAGQPSLSREEWLNVVDEAASLGVNCLVLSVGAAMSSFPYVWDVCDWAQRTHGMMVGIHCTDTALSDADIAAIQKLEGPLTRLLAPKNEVEKLRFLEEHGILIREADPRPGEQKSPCDNPTHMIFVNPLGQLYTCGLVEGMEEFHLGNVFNGTLDAMLHNAGLPHAISEQVPRNEHGCDGCPPLMAHFFESIQGGACG